MNDPILARGGADGEPCFLSRRAFIASLAALPAIPAAHVASASPAAATHPKPECVTWSDESATHTTKAAPLVRVMCALIAALAFYVLLAAAPAQARPQIKAHCEVYATNHVDPIAFSEHLHNQIGNTSTTNKSTGDSLFNSPQSSCVESGAGPITWFTSAGWFPVERNETDIQGVNVYYRAPEPEDAVRAIPKGLQLLAVDQDYNCGRGDPFQATPPYSCTGNWSTSVTFPDCIDPNQLGNEATNAVPLRNGQCPADHPYRIPRINFLVTHDNRDGHVTNPLEVSAGFDAWEDYTFMHADYFSANQPVFNNELIDLCLRDAPDSVQFADSRCGAPPK